MTTIERRRLTSLEQKVIPGACPSRRRRCLTPCPETSLPGAPASRRQKQCGTQSPSRKPWVRACPIQSLRQAHRSRPARRRRSRQPPCLHADQIRVSEFNERRRSCREGSPLNTAGESCLAKTCAIPPAKSRGAPGGRLHCGPAHSRSGINRTKLGCPPVIAIQENSLTF